jgi:hypothetical protein
VGFMASLAVSYACLYVLEVDDPVAARRADRQAWEYNGHQEGRGRRLDSAWVAMGAG